MFSTFKRSQSQPERRRADLPEVYERLVRPGLEFCVPTLRTCSDKAKAGERSMNFLAAVIEVSDSQFVDIFNDSQSFMIESASNRQNYYEKLTLFRETALAWDNEALADGTDIHRAWVAMLHAGYPEEAQILRDATDDFLEVALGAGFRFSNKLCSR